MTTASPQLGPGRSIHELAERLSRLYPRRSVLLLITVAGAGKVPLEASWNTTALERFEAAEGREAHVVSIARHLAAGGNVGWVVPPGCLVLDTDSPPATEYVERLVPEAPRQDTRPGRAHFVVRAPEGVEIRATVALELAPGVRVDLRVGGRSQIVCEPSRHPETGTPYRWVRRLGQSRVPACPEAIVRACRGEPASSGAAAPRPLYPAGKGADHWLALAEAGVAQGQRHTTLVALVGGLLAAGADEEAVRQEAHRFAGACMPPLTDRREVERAVADIAARERKQGPRAGGRGEREPAPEPTPTAPTRAKSNGAGELERERVAEDEPPSAREDQGLHDEAPEAAPDTRVFFDESGFVPMRMGLAIRQAGHVRLGVDGRLYRYADGVYRGDGDAYARHFVRAQLGERTRRRHLDEVLTWLRADFATIGADLPDPTVVNVANGLLEWKAGKLRPHTPDFVSTIQLPVPWRPGATSPRISAFLLEAVGEDLVPLVLELIGYAILPANPLRVAVLLLGPGRNGKSVLLAVIRAFLGPENVASVPLQLLSEHRFAAAELFGKLANVCGDLDARAVRSTDVFKMLTGGDPVFAERKHREPFTFVSGALPIFSANEPPLSSDQTDAWFDRWIVVPMEQRIPEERVDPQLAAKLTTREELEGLLVSTVEALRRLMARGRFELPARVRAAHERYRERLDTVRAFVAEECELSPVAWTPRATLYKAYRAWVQEGGRLPVSAVTFHDHLRRNHAGQLAERTREGSRGWAGIALRRPLA